MTKILKAIVKRRSVRDFIDKPIETENIEAILTAGMYAPSARNTKAYEFILVTDKALIEKLGDMKFHSMHAKKAAALIVICSPDWLYWLEDVSIVAAQMMLEAVNQGLGCCMIQSYESKTKTGSDAESYVREVLSIPAEIHVLGFLALGYPASTPPEHAKDEFKQEKIHPNRW